MKPRFFRLLGLAATALLCLSLLDLRAATSVPRFAYVPNIKDNTVSIYTVNASTGQLRDNGYVLAGRGPGEATLAGSFLYVSNFTSNNISAYSVNPSTGALKPVAGSPFPTGTGPTSLRVSGNGKFLFVSNYTSANVWAYKINSTSGALSPVAGSPFATGAGPYFVATERSGRYLYVANSLGDDISAYSISLTTGALKPLPSSPFAAGHSPRAERADPSGRFLYVANAASNDVSAYTINSTTGELKAVSGSPFAAGSNPSSVNVDVTGSFAYVANHGSNNVSAYRINASTGALTPVAGSPFAAGTQARFVQVDPSGKFCYVVNAGSNDVWTYTIQPGTGALTLTARGKVRARQAPMGVAFAAGSSPVTYTPKFAYVGNLLAGVFGYTVDSASGALTPISGSPFSGSTPRSVAVDPTGRFAYAANTSSDDVSGYLIDATTGALTPVAGSPFVAGGGPQSVAVDPSGRFAYVANFLDNTVSAYTNDSATGALTSIPGSPFRAVFPASVAVDPTGRFAYVTTFAQGTVSGYSINPTTGALTPIRGSPFAGAPSCIGLYGCGVWTSVTVDPTGKFAYVTDRTNAVAGFTIDATTGALKPVPGSPFPAGGCPGGCSNPSANGVVVDPSGEFAYMTFNSTSSAGVAGYAINATTGSLTPMSGSPFGAGTCGGDAFGGCDSMAVDPSGKFAYYVRFLGFPPGLPESGVVYGNTVNATTGALAPISGSPFPTASGHNATLMAVSGEIH
jgi:6-phosphogluconolactonase (cycloisomerase 2 family)